MQRLSQLSLLARLARQGQQPGERRSQVHGAGIEFIDYRNYAPGDDVRHVDWNAYARIGRLLVRLHEQPSDTEVQILIDHSASMGLGSPSKLDYALRLAAALAYVALNQLDRVTIAAFTSNQLREIRGARHRRNLLPMLDFLADLRPEGSTDLSAALTKFVSTRPRHGLAILISDLFDRGGVERAIDPLRFARLDTYLLQLKDPDELNLSDGEVELWDIETQEVRSLAVTGGLRERYRAAYDAALARLRSYCAEKHVNLFCLDTSNRPEDALFRVLRRSGMLR